jgi:hypothetical protein
MYVGQTCTFFRQNTFPFQTGSNQVRTNKPGRAGDQDFFHKWLQFLFFAWLVYRFPGYGQSAITRGRRQAHAQLAVNNRLTYMVFFAILTL